MTENTEGTQEGQEGAAEALSPAEGTEAPPKANEAVEGASEDGEKEPDTFPREYVEKLREESAKYRQKASDRDDIAQRLHVALVAASGRLADPDDLPFREDHLTDAEALNKSIDDLLARKPHLASRRVFGDIGQGVRESKSTVSLAGLLRANAQ